MSSKRESKRPCCSSSCLMHEACGCCGCGCCCGCGGCGRTRSLLALALLVTLASPTSFGTSRHSASMRPFTVWAISSASARRGESSLKSSRLLVPVAAGAVAAALAAVSIADRCNHHAQRHKHPCIPSVPLFQALQNFPENLSLSRVRSLREYRRLRQNTQPNTVLEPLHPNAK